MRRERGIFRSEVKTAEGNVTDGDVVGEGVGIQTSQPHAQIVHDQFQPTKMGFLDQRLWQG